MLQTLPAGLPALRAYQNIEEDPAHQLGARIAHYLLKRTIEKDDPPGAVKHHHQRTACLQYRRDEFAVLRQIAVHTGSLMLYRQFARILIGTWRCKVPFRPPSPAPPLRR